MTSTPDTEHNGNRWKLVSVVAILIALVSVILNVYFCLSDASEIAPSANNETNYSTVLNISDENDMRMHRIARVVITPGDTTKID